MLRSLHSAITCLTLLSALSAASVCAADRNEHLQYWDTFVGEWQLENQSLELTITRTESGCFLFDASDITFVHGWDPAEGKMRILSFYKTGAHGIGHATIEDGDMVGQSQTTNPDGTSRDATWRITRNSDAQFIFTVGDARLVFNRRD